MRPVLLRLEYGAELIEIKAYSTCLVLAALIAVGMGWFSAVRRGLHGRAVLVCLLLVTGAAFLGARMGYRALQQNLYAELAVGYEPGLTGLSLSGGLLLAAAAGGIACRLLRLDPWNVADAVAPGAGLAIAAARIGCLLNGCCFGEVTALPWGIRYPPGSAAFLHQAANRPQIIFFGPDPAHPVPVYELVAALAATLIAIVARKRARPGVAALAAATLFLTCRCGIGWCRPLPLGALWLDAGLLLAAGILLSGRELPFGWYKRAPQVRC